MTVLGSMNFNETSIDFNNYASVLQMDAAEVADVVFEGNSFYNMQYKAYYSSVIAIYYSKGNFTFRNNNAFNIGYLAPLTDLIQLPHLPISSDRVFDLNIVQKQLTSSIGFFDFEYNTFTEKNQHYLIENNVFRNVFADLAPIIYLLYNK